MLRKLTFAALFLLLGMSVEAALAAGGTHQHGGGGQEPSFNHCSKPENSPSLLCANVPTPHIAPDGSLWLIWAEHGHVYVGHRKNPASGSFEKISRITKQARQLDINGESRPKIAVGPQGDVYLTFTAKGEKKYTGVVYFAQSQDGGNSFSVPRKISDEERPSSQRFATLGVNKQGRIHIAWLDKRDLFTAKKAKNNYSGSAMYYAFSDDRGNSFSANKKGMDHSCECCRTAMDYDLDNNPVIIWRHIFGKNFRDHAMLKIKADGTPEKMERISEDDWAIDGCPHHGPDLSISGSGMRHVVWFTDADKRSGLFYAHQQKQGGMFSAPMGFGNPDNQAAHPQVLSVDEILYIVWKEFDGEKSSVLLIQSNDEGQSWSAPISVATTKGASDHPFLIKDDKGLYLSWATAFEGWQLFTLAQR